MLFPGRVHRSMTTKRKDKGCSSKCQKSKMFVRKVIMNGSRIITYHVKKPKSPNQVQVIQAKRLDYLKIGVPSAGKL